MIKLHRNKQRDMQSAYVSTQQEGNELQPGTEASFPLVLRIGDGSLPQTVQCWENRDTDDRL